MKWNICSLRTYVVAFLLVAASCSASETDNAADHALASGSASTFVRFYPLQYAIPWELRTEKKKARTSSGDTYGRNRDLEGNDNDGEVDAGVDAEEPMRGKGFRADEFGSGGGIFDQTNQSFNTAGRRRISSEDLNLKVGSSSSPSGPRGWSRRRAEWRNKGIDESEVTLAPGVDDAIPEAVEHGDFAWTVAFMLLGCVIVIVVILHLFNWDDAFVRLSAFRVLATAVSIVLAVIINEAVNVFIVNLIVGTVLAQAVQNAYHVVFGVCIFYVCFYALSKLLFHVRHRPVWLHAGALLICHILAVRGIFVFSAQSREWESSGTNQLIVIFVVLLAFCVHCSCCLISSAAFKASYGSFLSLDSPAADPTDPSIADQHGLREIEHAVANHWRFVVVEAEDFAGCIILSYLTFQAIAFAILGVVQPLNGYTTKTETHHVWYLLLVCTMLLLLFLVSTCVVILQSSSFALLSFADPTRASVRFANGLLTFLALTLLFCVLKVGEWALMISWPSYFSAMAINAAIMFCFAVLLIFVCQTFYNIILEEDSLDAWADDCKQYPVPLDDDLHSDWDDFDSASDANSDWDSEEAKRALLLERRVRVAAMDPIDKHERRHRIYTRLALERKEVGVQTDEMPNKEASLMRQCGRCGNRFTSDATYCNLCGARRREVQPRHIRPQAGEGMRSLRRLQARQPQRGSGRDSCEHGASRRVSHASHGPEHAAQSGSRPEHTNYPCLRHSFEILLLYTELPVLKVLRNFVLCLGVIVGVAVMKCIHGATKTVVIGNAFFSAELVFILLVVAVLLCVVVLPAWFLYLVPGARKTIDDHKCIMELEAIQKGGETSNRVATASFLKASEYVADVDLVDAVCRVSQRRPFIRPYLQAKLDHGPRRRIRPRVVESEYNDDETDDDP